MKEAHEIFIRFTSFAPTEMMKMSEKQALYWLDRVENSIKKWGLKNG